jgi:myo-inositol-1(or 4)-monophosphatase
MNNIKKLMPSIEKVMRKCGDIMLSARSTNMESLISSKEGRHNLVTEYDKRIQSILKDELETILPEALFYGEENGEQCDISKGYAFVVDPIDWTSNFIKNLDRSCISVGLCKDAQPIMGMIYDPYNNCMYNALSNEGAFLNGHRIHVSDDSLEDGIVTVGTAPYNEELTDISFDLFRRYFGKCIDIRRFGSAALDLCDVAAGRTCLYAEPIVSPWDICAGAVIVREAGGRVRTLDGGEINFTAKTSIRADNGKIDD